MRFSVILPSYLGHYEGAATNRAFKLTRAVDSIIKGTFQDFEVIVVADGCENSYNLIESSYRHDKRIDCLLIKKQRIWSGKQRNAGLKKCNGEYVVYLDSDDKFGANHLFTIDEELKKNNDPDWVFFNDFLIEKTGREVERNILINQRFQNGTSNICHKRELDLEWGGNGQYGQDDWDFIQKLHKFNNRVKIRTPQYHVCHFPAQRIDV